MKNKLAALLLALGLIGCPTDGCDSPTTPVTPVPPAGADLPGPEPEEPFNPGPHINIREMEGFSAFALATSTEMQQRAFLRFAQNRGYNTARVCAEVCGWEEPVWPNALCDDQKTPEVDEALEGFKRTLEIVADEGMQMLVVAICGRQRAGNGPKAEDRREEWVRKAAKAGKDYNNLAWEAVNEYKHPNSFVDRDEAARLISIIRRITGHLVSTDHGIRESMSSYRHDSGLGGDFADFHPERNPDPTPEFIREIVRANGGFAVLSETTAWIREDQVGIFRPYLVTTDKGQIRRYQQACRPRDGCVFFFHSYEGLRAEEFTWMPRPN